MRVKRISAVLAAAAVATVGVLGAVSPASAEPISGYPTYAGTGSDTTQDVLNALANGGVLTDVGSWNAFGLPAAIQVSATGPTFTRPAGSSAGIKALSASIQGKTYGGAEAAAFAGELDFARSSRAPKKDGTDLTFIPFARDAVTYVTNNPALASLTPGQLTELYSTNEAGDLVITVDGVEITVNPVLPQADSGTRAFFLGALGLTTPGSEVNATTVPENDASVFTAPNSIVPFSAAAWIAQKNGVSANTIPSGVSIGSIGGVSPVIAGISLAPNVTFYSSSTFGRDVYNVVSTSTVLAEPDSVLVKNFTSTLHSDAASDVIEQYGFKAVAYAGDTGLVGSPTDLFNVDGIEHAKQGAFE